MENIGRNQDWEAQKSKLIEKFNYLTNNDFRLADENKKAMVGILQERLGKTKEQLQKILNGL